MSESQTVKIPLEITPPAQSQERPAPEWARKSLHNVKMPRREVQLEPEWVNNGPNVEVRWREAEQRAEPSPTGEPAQSYQQQGVNFMEQNQPDNQQQQQGSAQPPDISQYDLYDELDMVRYHHDNAAYMQFQIDARVQAHLAPHAESLEQMKWTRDYNDTQARYGDAENFKEVLEVAMQRVVDEKGRISILQAYQEADNKSTARPGQKGSAHLPEAFRDKKRGIGMLGRIMHHNQQAGRAKFEKRGW